MAAPSGRTRAKARRRSIQNRTRNRDRGVRGWSHRPGRMENIPSSVGSLKQGRMRHAEAEFGCVCAPPPPATQQAPKPAASAQGASLADRTGNSRVRVRVVECFEKQTSDEHIFHRDLPRGALQGVRRARFLALGKPLPGCFPDDRGRQRWSEEGVPAFRGVPIRFTREGRTRGLRGLRGSRLGNEPYHGVRRLGFHAPWP